MLDNNVEVMRGGSRGNNRMESLQVCRALAALLIVINHFSINSTIFLGRPLLHSFFMFGSSGVSFFCVLSGFIICYTHWKDIGGGWSHLNAYAVKRLTRVFPAYWPVLIAATLLYIFFGSYSLGLHQPITLLSFLKNVFLVSYGSTPIVSVTWTLQFELLFYLFFSLFIIRLELGLVFIVVWPLFIFLYNKNIFVPTSDIFKYIGNFYCIQFLVGFFVAYVIIKWKKYVLLPRLMVVLGAIGFLFFGVSYDYYSYVNPAYYRTIFVICSVFVVMGLAKLELERPIRGSKIFVYLGGASYSIYLTHDKILSVFYRFFSHAFMGLNQFPQLRFYILVCIIVTATVLMGCFYFQFFEKPCAAFVRSALKNVRAKKRVSAIESV